MIGSLFDRTAISLPDVLKVALAFEAALKYGDQSAIAYFGLSSGNPLCPTNGQRIVPAIRLVDPKKLRRLRESVDGSEIDFNDYLTRSGRSAVPMGFFNSFLEKGYAAGNGGRTGSYLITEITARAIYDYLMTKKGGIGPGIDEVFPNDPDLFPGNGLYCEPLPPKYGNLLA